MAFNIMSNRIFICTIVALLCVSCEYKAKFKRVENKRMGYNLMIPATWSAIIKETPNSFQLNFTIPDQNDTVVFLQSRYIQQIPEGVTNHREWQELQYEGINGELEFIRERQVNVGSCMEVRFINKTKEKFVVGHGLNFVDVFDNPQNLRMWVFGVVSTNAEFFEGDTFDRLIKSLRVSRFNWQDIQSNP